MAGETGGTWGAGASVASTALSIFGTLKAGSSAAASYKYKAGMALINKQLALQNADYARKIGEVQAGESGLKSRFQMGKILTGQSASGFDVNSGSAVGVRSSQQKIAQIDQGLIRANAARRAYGYDVEAAKDEAESGMNLRAASDVKSASKLTAITSLISGASSVADKWTQASQYGLGSSNGPTFSGTGAYSEDPDSLAQSSRGGGYGGDAF